jgi:hypothetical protein
MTTKTRTRLVRVVLGLLSGSAITALLTAVLFFTAFYTAAHESHTSVILGWAYLAGLGGGTFGYIVGLVLGLFLGLTQLGPKFGALTGAVLGIGLLTANIIFNQSSGWEPHESVLVAGILPVTVLSGFLISLILSVTASLTRTDDTAVPCSVAAS